MTDTYDLVAIGSGPAGESATELAAFFGHRSAIVEKNKPGGTVTTTGGAPTKTLREAALYLSGLREGDVYGLRMAAAPEVATDIIRQRTTEVCELLQKVTRENIASRGVDYVEGTARLDPSGQVVVTRADGTDLRLRSKVVLIATGSRPFRPQGISFEIPGVCETDTILHRGRVPRDIVIVGGGAVGVEFATICYAIGAKVTLLERGKRLMSLMDEELAARMQQLFAAWGVEVRFDSTVESVAGRNEGLDVRLVSGETLRPDTLLFAGGRVANTGDLGLAAAKVKVDNRGRIVVDEKFRTSAGHVYAAGDVLGPTLASIAMEQGRAAVCHAFGIPFEGHVDPSPVSAIYGMPEVAGAGLREEQCREQGLDYEVGRADLAVTPRGAIAGRGGLLKLIFRKSDRRLLGVHCIGDLASEVVGIGQMAIRLGGTLHTIVNMSFNTPTYSYAYKYAAIDGFRRLKAGGREPAGAEIQEG